ncbi:unnamed protein product [Rotaria sp. Silwood2]|nr:unnamed protein product [Rotaria sp. Silwood2]
MDSYTTIWTNQNDNYSCIDPAFLPYNLIEQNPRKDLSNKMLNTALSGQMKKEHGLRRLHRYGNEKRNIDIHYLNN